MIDETRIERALREGPPFRTHYVPGSLMTGQAALRPEPLWASLVLVVVAVMLALVVGGEVLIGSGVIKVPVLTQSSATPSATPVATLNSNDPSTWIATGIMVTPRSGGHTVTLLTDGTVLVAGGAAGGTYPGLASLASAELIDPATLSWTSTGSMTQARAGHTATLLRDGRVLVAGGGDPNGNGRKFDTAELYDPATGRWTATGDMTESRNGHTATLLPDGKVLVTGGSGGGLSHKSAELYDPATGKWTATGDLIQGRSSHTATLLRDGTVLAAGGVFGDDAGSCCGPLSSAELFDPHTESWTATGSMIELRGGSTATLLLDGRVLVAGEINGGVVPTSELYDPAAGSWSPTPNMVEPRTNLTATLLLDGRVFVAGGTIHVSPYVFTGLTSAEVYDPASGSWIRTRSMHAIRGEGQVAVRLADGRVLVVGGLARMEGRDRPVVLSDPGAEVFDPNGGG